MTEGQQKAGKCSRPSDRKRRRQVGRSLSPKITRTDRSRELTPVHSQEQRLRLHLSRLLNSAMDELIRAAVKASLSGAGVLALYWWSHHN
jgi:hypothetical protein